jgi:hypothetical protein
MCARKQARRLFRPGLIPVQSFISLAVQGPTANVFWAVAPDAHSMRAAQTIKTILIIEFAPSCTQLLHTRDDLVDITVAADKCQLLALLGPRVMSDLSPQSGPNRTLIRPLADLMHADA